KIHTFYRSGVMSYTIKDPILKGGELKLNLVALAESEGFILKLEAQNIPTKVSLLWVYGGASGKKFWRSGDIGADPESVFYLHPKYGRNINNKKIRLPLKLAMVPRITNKKLETTGAYMESFLSQKLKLPLQAIKKTH